MTQTGWTQQAPSGSDDPKNVGNSLSNTDVSRLDRVTILSIFVKQDETTHLEETRSPGKKRRELTSTLLASYGAKIDKHYLVPTTTDKDDNDDDDDSVWTMMPILATTTAVPKMYIIAKGVLGL
jgi:hypothetical protein